MNNTSFKSYKLKIFQHTKYIKNTINIYQNLINFLINIYAKEKELFKNLNSKEQLKLMERLIHKTDKNSPKYKEYNQNFHKLPSYFRRSGIMEVLMIKIGKHNLTLFVLNVIFLLIVIKIVLKIFLTKVLMPYKEKLKFNKSFY